MKAVVFLILSFNGVNAGLIDHDMLPYALFVSFSGLLGMTVYRESSPIQPEPRVMSATLVTLTKFIHPRMYADLPAYQGQPEPSLCTHAFHFNQAFLVVQYMMLLLGVGLFSIAVYTIAFSPRDYLDVRLAGTRATLTLVPVIMTGYLLTLLAKEIVAVETMQVAREGGGEGQVRNKPGPLLFIPSPALPPFRPPARPPAIAPSLLPPLAFPPGSRAPSRCCRSPSLATCSCSKRPTWVCVQASRPPSLPPDRFSFPPSPSPFPLVLSPPSILLLSLPIARTGCVQPVPPLQAPTTSAPCPSLLITQPFTSLSFHRHYLHDHDGHLRRGAGGNLPRVQK